MIAKLEIQLSNLLTLNELISFDVRRIEPVKEWKEASLEHLKDALAWVDALINGPVADYRAIRKLRSEEIWQRYATWGDTNNFREVILLQQAAKNFRKALNENRPILFKDREYERNVKVKKRRKPSGRTTSATGKSYTGSGPAGQEGDII